MYHFLKSSYRLLLSYHFPITEYNSKLPGAMEKQNALVVLGKQQQLRILTAKEAPTKRRNIFTQYHVV